MVLTHPTGAHQVDLKPLTEVGHFLMITIFIPQEIQNHIKVTIIFVKAGYD